MNRNLVNNIWIVVAFFLFGIVYYFSGTYAYLDGDDAASMAYHTAGRNRALQPPYTPYHGMMDKMLSFLPAQEELVRTVAFGTTRLANILMVVLTLALVFDWLRSERKQHALGWYGITPVLVLLAAPELFYIGLVYAPTFVAMSLILSAHLLLRWSRRNTGMTERGRLFWYVFSAILFGFGVAFRWNTLTYGVIVVVDLLTILPAATPLSRRLGQAAGWGVLAFVSSFLMINLSGYGINDFIAQAQTALYVINQAGTLSPESAAAPLSEVLMRTGLTLTPLFTPVFVLLILLGLIKLARERNPLVYVILAGFISILPWLRSGVPKFMITSVPLFILAFVAGIDVIADFANRGRNKVPVYALLFVGLLTPWLVGVRVARSGLAWGPGFEKKPYNYQDVSGTSFDITLGAGMAFPTPEGVRPLYGHAYVLLGKWKERVVSRMGEETREIDTALSLDIPVVSTGWCPDWYLIEMYSRGYTTTDPARAFSSDGYFHERKFRDTQGNTFTVLDTEVDGSDITDLVYYMKNTEYQKVILTGYSKTLRTFYETYPDTMQALGTSSAIIDLEKLRAE
ncbi:MAG: hypothetical protein HY865_18060 [Chloroflexi bacterium]|nr:hypothetical protein [Chloroflexota bacterium]